MSKKEKVLKITYEVLGQIIGIVTSVFVLFGIGYSLGVMQYFSMEEFTVIIVLGIATIVPTYIFVRIFSGREEIWGEGGIRVVLMLIVCFFFIYFFSPFDEEVAMKTILLAVISWVIRKWIEFVVKKGKYDTSCIGYRNVIVREKEVMVHPLYSKFIWKIFLSHFGECPEEKKKIMLQEMKTFADRTYKLNTEDLELLGIVDDKRSYVKQVEIYYDRKNQRLVKYYRYDYENYENMGRLEKFLLGLRKKVYTKLEEKFYKGVMIHMTD